MESGQSRGPGRRQGLASANTGHCRARLAHLPVWAGVGMAGLRPSWSTGSSTQATRPRKEQRTMPGARTDLGGHLRPCEPSHSSSTTCGSGRDPGALSADAPPRHTTVPLLSLRAQCPETPSSLPPDAKAPAAAPEPGTALAAAGKARFPEATGPWSWWGQEQHGDSRSPALPTSGLQREGPGNKGEPGRDGKGTWGRRATQRGTTERGRDGHGDRRDMEPAQSKDAARGNGVKQPG